MLRLRNIFAVAILATAFSCAHQDEAAPTSRPAADDVEARKLPADWGDEGPGHQVMPQKLLPITQAPYSRPQEMVNEVQDDDLVIGMVRGGEAFAWPIKMLGGPMREIVNHRIDGELFAVNW